MDKFQATFEILYLLSTVDGSLDDAEVDVIGDFIKQNSGYINFDIKQTIAAIESLTPDGKLEELVLAAKVVNDSASAKDKNIILNFALELIAADGKLDENEKDIFQALAQVWNIDIKRFLEQKVQS